MTFLGTKEVEMSIRRAVGAAFKPSTTLYEGEEINSMILIKGGKTLLRLIRRWVRVFRERPQDNQARNIRGNCYEKYRETMIPCACKLRRYGGTEIVRTNRVV